MEIDAKKIMLLTSKLNNLLEGYDEFYLSKKTNLTIKDKLLVFLLNGDVPPYELLKFLGIAKTNLALIISKMENDGLITKKRDLIDKRNILISLTVSGNIKANEILEKINKNINNALAYKNNGEKINALLDSLNAKIK
ncbi:MAG: MarR family transcriptional regulator [Clostridia bacterium]|nr:MarR family transcriptional regulator [Clostridia bacterium]